MGNEEQQPPSFNPEASGQQEYYGWQYDQGNAKESLPPQQAKLPPARPYEQPAEPLPPPISPLSPVNRQPPLQPQYQEPIQDMGTSLGYGQSTEYHYFETPQPSQPIAQLRQERLQRLREDRMRRQQRRLGGPDITNLIAWGTKRLKQPPVNNRLLPPAIPSPVKPGRLSGLLSSLSPGSPEQALPMSADSVAPSDVSVHEVSSVQMSPSSEASAIVPLQSAEASAQDTGMIQRVRIGKAALILTVAFVASRVLGLVRTSMFAFVFGAGATSDAYLQAFLIPDLIFNVVAGGALSSAFIPVFTKYMVGDKDEKSAWHIASSALNLAIAIMMVLALLAIALARVLVPFYNHGVDSKQLDLIASLTRIMLLQSVALGGGVIVTSVLNARQDFRLPAIGTVLYNVGLIVGLLPGLYYAFHGERDNTFAVYAATWGVVIGALLQVGVQIPGLWKVGMKYDYKAFDWRHPGVIQMGRQMVPRIINAVMLYVSFFVDRSLIQLLVVVVGEQGLHGLITQYYQAFQLVLLPIGIFGSTVSTAAFPTLAENVTRGRMDRVRNTIMETLRSIVFLSLPSSIGLMVLGFPIIQVLLQHGAFQLSMAQSMSIPLGFFALGLTGLAAVEILTRAFYALRDSVTPVIVSVAQFLFKIALSLVLIDAAVWGTQWGMGALAFSTSLGGLLEAVVLYWLLRQRVGDLPVREIGVFILRVLLASLAMGLVLLVLRFIVDHIPFLDTTQTPALGLVGTIVAIFKLLLELFVAIFVYIRAARMLGIEELGPVKRVLDRFKLSWI